MSFQQGLSGLNASSKNLEIIGNNIANANTYGSKIARGEFSDVYAAALNGSGSNSVGLGTNLSTVAQQFTQGSITTTENTLDLAISGDGFFRMVDKQGENQTFTRNGQFKLDGEGYIVNNSGQRLTGLQRGQDLTSDKTALKLPPSGHVLTPKVTEKVTLDLSLDSRAELATAGALDLTKAKGTSVTIYDQQGEAASLALYFQKVDVNLAGESTWEVYADLPGDNANTHTLLTGATFTAAGTLMTTGLDELRLWDDTAVPSPVPVNFGTRSPVVDIHAMTAFAGNFVVSDMQQDGYARGTLVSVNVDKDGSVKALYSNGKESIAGTVTLAKFRNPQGLQPVGDNAWKVTGAEGTPNYGRPGDSSVGLLQSGALEESNIDLTGELVNMITAQRNYQANAQTIKTQDQVLQTLVNLR